MPPMSQPPHAPPLRRPRAQLKAGPDTAPSAARRAYELLRQRILDLSLPPGARIVELAIAAELGLSRTPVHEAVQRLADEGLVEIHQRVGTFVARIPLEGLEEAMLVRSALEQALVERIAARKPAPPELIPLEQALAEQGRAAERGDDAAFHAADEAFHAALAALAGFPGVWRTIQQAKIQVDRLRRLTLPLQGRMDMVIAEHLAVAQALSRGEAAQARAAMRHHLDQVLPMLEMTRALRPDYFVAAR